MSKEAGKKSGNEDEPRGLYERLKSQDDGWELWAILGVGLLGLQLIAYAVAFLRLGQPSVIAHSMVISILGILTMPMMFWGLIRALFRPPVWRLSRTLAFGSLLAVGFMGNVSLFPAPVSTGDWQADQDYYLPFDGAWVTLAGGDDKERNYHLTTMAHRWGYDFAPLVDGNRYEGDGSDLEDHHCYGAKVRAPVGGEVVQVLGSEEDHPPGEYDPNNILGNHVVIEVGPDEFLFMAHLRNSSLEVGTGDEVEAGDPVAQCGNSGRTQTPHLHIHLQNSLDFPMTESLPLRFSDYLADGEAVELGMPLGGTDYERAVGEIVENQVSWAQRLGEDEDETATDDEEVGGEATSSDEEEAAREAASEVESTVREAVEKEE